MIHVSSKINYNIETENKTDTRFLTTENTEFEAWYLYQYAFK